MAGAGTRLYVAGEVLTAAQVNTYLQDQTIGRYATTAARDAAFGGAGEPTLAEGMFAYIDSEDTVYYYSGSAWVNLITGAETTSTVTTTTQTALQTFPIATYRAAMYTVQVTRTPGTYYSVFDATIIHNGTTAYLNTSNFAVTTANQLTELWEADISASNARLLFTSPSATYTYTIKTRVKRQFAV